MVSFAALCLVALLVQDPPSRGADREPAVETQDPATDTTAESESQTPAEGESSVTANEDVRVARLARIADPVAFLDGESQAERMLFYWNKFTDLMNGDGARQGDAGICEVVLERDLSTIRMFGANKFFVERTDDGWVQIRFLEVHRVIISAKDQGVRVVLPDGSLLDATGTWFRVTRDDLDRRYVVRNGGPLDLEVRGSTQLRDVAVLRAGEVVQIPIVTTELAVGESGVRADVWEGLVVRAEAGVERSESAGQLVLSGAGTAEVGGAKIVLTGQRVLVRRPRIESDHDE